MTAPHWLTLVSEVALLMGSLSIVGSVFELVVRRRDCALRGKVISRPMVRLIGRPRARAVRSTVSLALVTSMFAPSFAQSFIVDIGWTLIGLWYTDDFITGRDDDRWKRWRDKAANRLKKIAAARIRPVDRWAPSPA